MCLIYLRLFDIKLEEKCPRPKIRGIISPQKPKSGYFVSEPFVQEERLV